jgi:quinoprotein glucose dehydrogenase
VHLGASLLVLIALAQDPANDPELAVRKLQPAPGLKAALFAAEPDVVNPVGLAVDDRGRVFLAETRRYNTSALYILRHGDWYFDDLACRTVEDRVAVSKKYLGAGASRLEVDSEVVRLLEDRDGDGRADRASVFADGFRTMLDGVASGVLARGDTVWLTNVPSLWRLRDAKGEGRADERQELHRGFGVRFGNSGHDLHGPCFGPDGKIYFSMGDRGFRVGKFDFPDEGAVLRCNPDGSGLEVFARGLRNPQGLAFDAQGNLWTCDNNADMGDKARWLWVVEGGDYGWRVGYQYATDPWAHQEIPKGHRLAIFRDGPWMAEDLWRGGAPYVLPPVGHVTAGPCGMDFYPGTGLPGRYRDHFVVCDFSFGVYSCAVRPRGASFELVDVDRFLWGLWTTDAKFGPDGALYVTDWIGGYPMTGKGRVYRVFDPNAPPSDTKPVLARGMAGRPLEELNRLLGHADLRVRRAAQVELVERRAVDALSGAPGLHAVWGLGQLRAADRLVPRLGDADAEVRAHAARLLGELRAADAFESLRKLAADPSLRVRFFALPALARTGGRKALPLVLEFLKDPAHDDPFLRHAAVLALAEAGDLPGLLAAAEGACKPVRLAVLLALRRLERAEVRRFLRDPDPDLVLEAARAINDVPIPGAMADLAALEAGPPRALLRAVSARFRRGLPEDAAALPRAPAEVRAEALQALAAWGRPSGRERITGQWRGASERDDAPAREALARSLPELVKDAESVRVHALRAAAKLRVEGFERLAEGVFGDRAQPAAARVEALRSLGAEAVPRAAADPDPLVRREGIRLAPRLAPREAATLLAKASDEGPAAVRQTAVTALASVPGPEAERALEGLLDRLLEGRLEAALHLEVLEAAGRRKTPGLRDRLARHEASRRKDDALAAFRETLDGGDADEGRRIFFERATAACLRCHKVAGTGGDVGPDLKGIGAQRTREQLLESILYPNKEIAPGYGQEVFRTDSETVEVGRVKSESAGEVVLVRADGTELRLPKARIAARKAGLSAMPEDVAKTLTKRDLRDLVAYLAGLR